MVGAWSPVRGTSEKRNGRLRCYLFRKTVFDTPARRELDEIVGEISDTR